MKKAHIVLFLVLICIMVGSLAHAQGEVQNLDVADADIRDVFRSLGELGDYNVLLDKKVQGSITFKVSNPLPVKDIIELLAQTYGYTYQWVSNGSTVIVGDKETFKNFDNRFTKVYRLNYANVDQATEALKVVVPVEQIGKDQRANQLTIRGNVIEHENIQEIIKIIDREVPQVNIEARIEEISESDVINLGFKPNIAAGYNNLPVVVSNDGASSGTSTFVGSGWYLRGMTSLVALEKASKARMLANPNISTTDNQEGRIMIGEKYPIITSSDSARGITYTVNYIEVGTKLTVTPRINSDNIVTVSVFAEVSNIDHWEDVGLSKDKIPIIKTREARSVIRLKDGDTFVLSGLVKKNSSESNEGTPFLSKIPVLGWLFKSKNNTPTDNLQICIFLTPRIVRYSKDETVNSTENVKQNETVQEDKKSKEPKNEEVAPAKEEEPQSSSTKQDTQQTTQEKPLASDDNTKADSVTVVEPVKTQEESPAPPPEPIQVVIDEKTPVADTKPATTTETPAVENKGIKPSTGAEREIQYTLKKGETIFQISRKFGVNAKDVLNRNNMTAKDTVKVGQVVVVPIPSDHLYQMQPKETFWRIAKRYGTTVEELVELNGLTDATQVKVGQTIVLPVAAGKVVNSQY